MTSDKYISVKQLAEILNKTERTIQYWCNSGKVQSRKVIGNGGEQYEILVSSLDTTTQKLIDSLNMLIDNKNDYGSNFSTSSKSTSTAVFFNESTKQKTPISISGSKLSTEELQTKSSTAFLSNFNQLNVSGSSENNFLQDYSNPNAAVSLREDSRNLLDSFGLMTQQKDKIIPEEEKIKALLKVDIINAWNNYRKNTKSKTTADKLFIKSFNSGFISKSLLEEIGKISRTTIHRWATDYRNSNNNWEALVPNYNYGCESKFNSSMSYIERYLLLKYMLHQNRLSLGRAYEYIKLELQSKGIECSNIYTYRRAWEYICRNHAEKVAFARHGQKSMTDTQSPHLIRDWSKLSFGDMIVGDGHTLDFMVKNPFTGKPCRATLLGFQDVASGDLVGFDIMLTENTQVIASALRNAIIYMGKKPKVVQLDNGRAFKGQYFTSKTDFENCGIKGLYARLGIETYFSRAYNGRAKIIERFFKELTESHSKMWSSYIGNNIVNKPAYTMRNEKFHRELQGDDCPTIDEVKTAFTNWLEHIYRQRPCRNDKNITIAEYVKSGMGEGIDIDELDTLMMAIDKRKIGRNGVRMFDSYYWNDKLFGINDYCVIKYSFSDLSFVKVYSLKGEFICRADRCESVHPVAKLLGTPKDYEEYKAQLRAKDKVIKERLMPLKKQLKEMYPIKKIKAKSVQNIKPVKTEEIYKISYAEDEDIINLDTTTYEIDYTQFDIEEKVYNI